MHGSRDDTQGVEFCRYGLPLPVGPLVAASPARPGGIAINCANNQRVIGLAATGH